MVNFNQELEELLGDFASPIRQAKPALELNSVWAGCLVTPLVQDGQQITKLSPLPFSPLPLMSVRQAIWGRSFL